MQALRPAPALEDPAGELVDDLHLAVDHRVVVVALEERLGLQRLDQVVDEGAVLGEVEVLDADELLRLRDAALGRRDGLVLLVVLVVVLGLVRALRLAHRLQLLARRLAGHLLRQAGERVVEVGGLLGGAGDDQRRPRLVDEDVVDLVDDREVVAALDRVLQRDRHVVAQVVEAELGVRPVDDVAGVLRVAGARVVAGLDHADGHAERVVERLHPLRVAAGQVVVDGDQVDGVAGERVEEDREGRREGLALAGRYSRLYTRRRAYLFELDGKRIACTGDLITVMGTCWIFTACRTRFPKPRRMPITERYGARRVGDRESRNASRRRKPGCLDSRAGSGDPESAAGYSHVERAAPGCVREPLRDRRAALVPWGCEPTDPLPGACDHANRR